MLQDNSGNIWFGTGGGVSRYNGKSFTSFTVKDGLASNAVHAMVQDKNGTIWIGTNAGVSCYDGKSFNDFKNNEGYPFVNVRSIIQDKTGNIWIGGSDGLFNTKSRTTITESFTGNLFEDKAGYLWLTAADTARGMDLMSFDNKPVRNSNGMVLYRYNGYALERIFENDNQVFGITQDRDGNIWFGTAVGVSRYDARLPLGSKKTFTDFKKESK